MSEGEPADRLYPPRPILSVSVCVFRAGLALVARRARAPYVGLFSLPGGAVEIGEHLHDAALRELKEELGVAARIVGFNDFVEPIVREGGRVRSHYVIASFVALWTGGEARASAEMTEPRWIAAADCAELDTTPGLPALVARAAAIMEAAR